MIDTEPLFKLFYKELVIEVTRRCNMACAHCMRGDAQNHSISKEVVDRIFEEVGAIGELLLTGGEPFLEPEMIDYICNQIVEKQIPIMSIQIVTNGTIRDERIAESLNKLTDYIAGTNFGQKLDKKKSRQLGKILISNDDYHSQCDIMDTLKFYRGCLNDHSIILRKNARRKKSTEKETIDYLGNATKDTFKLKENQEFRYLITPYRVSFFESIGIDTMIQIGWDGKVLIGQDSSYEQQDKNNYGNIMDKHISTLFKDGGAFDEPFTEEEAHRHDAIYSTYKNKNFETYDEDICKVYLHVFECVYNAREVLHRVFPQLSFEEVCDYAYHDVNLTLKDAYGDDFDFPRIDKLEFFNTPRIVSQLKRTELAKRFPIQYIIGYFKVFGKELKPIPDSITRERYAKF